MAHIKKKKRSWKNHEVEYFFGILLLPYFRLWLLPLLVTPYPQSEHGSGCPLSRGKSWDRNKNKIEPHLGFWNSKSDILWLRSWIVCLVFIVNNSMLSSPWVTKRIGGRGRTEKIWKEKERSGLKGIHRMKKLDRYTGLD